MAYKQKEKKRDYSKRVYGESVLTDVQKEIQMIFMERFAELIGTDGYAKFGEKIGTNRSSVYNYAHGIRFPTAAALVNIANKCNVSVDWLLGRDEIGRREQEN